MVEVGFGPVGVGPISMFYAYPQMAPMLGQFPSHAGCYPALFMGEGKGSPAP